MYKFTNCAICDDVPEYYVVKNSVWYSINPDYFKSMLCIRCLENQIGRSLNIYDIHSCPASIATFTEHFNLYSDPHEVPAFVKRLSDRETPMDFSEGSYPGANTKDFLKRLMSEGVIVCMSASKQTMEAWPELLEGPKSRILRLSPGTFCSEPIAVLLEDLPLNKIKIYSVFTGKHILNWELIDYLLVNS